MISFKQIKYSGFIFLFPWSVSHRLPAFKYAGFTFLIMCFALLNAQKEVSFERFKQNPVIAADMLQGNDINGVQWL